MQPHLNSGYDHAVLMALGLPLSTDRTLLHGVGCAGGLSLVRLAHQLSRVPVDPSPTSKPNRILVISAEVTSTLCRSEIDELNKASKAPDGDKGWPNVSLCLFSDGASAMIVGAANSEGQLKEHGKPLHWTVAAFFDLRSRTALQSSPPLRF